MQQDLIILISKIADEIADSVPVGMEIPINGAKYEVVEPHTDQRFSRYLTVHGGRVIYGSPSRSWYENSEESRVLIESADRKDYLFFANNWLQMIRALGAEDKIITELRQQFPNFLNPWDEFDDVMDEYELLKNRCMLIMNNPNSTDQDKEEASIALAICELLVL